MMTVDEILDNVVAILAQNGINIKQTEGIDRLHLVDCEREQTLAVNICYDCKTRAEAVEVGVFGNFYADGVLYYRTMICYAKINQRKRKRYIRKKMEQIIDCYRNSTMS